MSRFTAVICCLAVLVALPCQLPESMDRSGSVSNIPQVEVVLIKLSEPVYPGLARQARIAGNVALTVGVRKDGTVESADVISGPGMLRQAALDSVRQSQFS